MNNSQILMPISLSGIAPMIVVAITMLVVMIAIALKRSHRTSFLLSALGLFVAFVWTLLQLFGAISFESGTGVLLSLDGFALFNAAVILFSALVCTSLAYEYFDKHKDHKEELYLLMLTATLGGQIMTASEHLLSFFMGLELLSVPMYGMLAYAFKQKTSLESGMKYLILSAVASATLLFGMALLYAGTGSLSFGGIKEATLSIGDFHRFGMLGAVLIVVAVAFKLSLAPFHAWVGDVYQGAVPPVVAFLASASKVAAVAVAVRFFVQSATPALVSVDTVLVWLVVLSVLIGNLLALHQSSIKRLLAYSSIAHMGYVMMIVIAQAGGSDTAVSVYMFIYALTSLGAFGVLVLMTGNINNKEADDIAHYQGLFWRRPVLTAVMTVMLLSLAGIPMTAGFMTKMQAMMMIVEGGHFGLAVMLVVGSAIGLYYYLKMMLIMYKRPLPHIRFDVPNNWRMRINGMIVIAILVVVVVFGLLPSLMFDLGSLAVIR